MQTFTGASPSVGVDIRPLGNRSQALMVTAAHPLRPCLKPAKLIAQEFEELNS